MILPLIGYALLALVGLGAVLWIVGAFNDLIRLRAKTHQEFANIDVVLRQRHDEIPSLVAVCKGYIQHEAAVLEKVTALRSDYQRSDDINAKVLLENELHLALFGLVGIVENYPDLKANEQFLRLQKRLTELETTIADRRELYNQAVTYYNTAIEQFPQLVLAWLFRFRPLELFALESLIEGEATQLNFAGSRS